MLTDKIRRRLQAVQLLAVMVPPLVMIWVGMEVLVLEEPNHWLALCLVVTVTYLAGIMWAAVDLALSERGARHATRRAP
jgi:hypothetical protein